MSGVWENEAIRSAYTTATRESDTGKRDARGAQLWGARCERAKMKRVEYPLHKLDLISCATNLAI